MLTENRHCDVIPKNKDLHDFGEVGLILIFLELTFNSASGQLRHRKPYF